MTNLKSSSIKSTFLIVPLTLAFSIACTLFPVPAIATTAEQDQSQIIMRAKSNSVIDTYKSFYCNTFMAGQYDVKYRTISFHTSYSLKEDKVISYYSGVYKTFHGKIAQHKCYYRTW